MKKPLPYVYLGTTRQAEGELVSDSKAHLSEWTLEQLAEGLLSEYEHQSATTHIDACPRCAGELDACRTLFTALAGLPRFAPSPSFGDVVISRIHIGPRPSPMVERVRRWLPATRRGWFLVAAALITPALPLVALLVWLLSQPMVSAVSLLEWGSRWGAETASSALTIVARWEAAVGLDRAVHLISSLVSGLPLGIVLTVAVLMALGIPLSAWSLVRLVRTPMGDVHYAN